jgi:hypothetical protein
MGVGCCTSAVPTDTHFDIRTCGNVHCSKRFIPTSKRKRYCSRPCREGRPRGTYNPAAKNTMRVLRLDDDPALEPETSRLRAELAEPPRRVGGR